LSPRLEIAIRVGCCAAVFANMALWEWWAPRRKLTAGRRPRWPGNLGMLAIDIAAVRLLVPATAVGVALVAGQEGWGLFRVLGLPFWAAFVAGVIALDLVIYLQHVVFNYVPVL
jgi:sterol desaturase/sphingolipid hydroxylase (fatty acid hydroxylase superfamily)